jgi:hypothetical protein
VTVQHYRRRPGGGRFLLVNAPEAARHLLRAHGVRVRPETIRQWAARGRIGSHSLGRDRYDIAEIEQYAKQIGLVQAAGSDHI